MDIIILDHHNLTGDFSEHDTLRNYARYTSIKSYSQGIDDIYELKREYPDINYRYYVQPSTPLTDDMLSFDNKTVTWPMQEQGRADAKNVVLHGPGYMFEKMDEWKERKDKDDEFRNEFPTMGSYISHISY